MTPRARRTVGAAAAAAFLLLFTARTLPAAPTDADCLECHGGDETLSMKKGGKTVSLYVRAGVLKGSAHATVACIRCHVGFVPEDDPHKANITPVDCRSCHKDAAAKHTFHSGIVAARARSEGAQSCKGCHGTHEVRPAPVRKTALGPGQLDAACARCHAAEVAQYRESAHGRAAAAGQPGAPQCATCHEKALAVGPHGAARTAEFKLEVEGLCLSCHLDDPKVRSRTTPSAGFIAAFDKSVHGAALHAGNAKAATCTDCHGAHEMAKGFEARSRANKRRIPETCGACHGRIAQEYAASVHGTAVAKGSEEAPVCTDCHGEHAIRKARAADSPVAPANVSEKVCSPCHSSVRLTAKYGIRNDRFRTFSDSFHGLAIRGGSVSAANCASCHGAHNILPSKDPRSTINPVHLAATCGKCHPGANAAFATGKVHVETTEAEEPLLYWIATIYTILIVVTIGGMLAHNALDFLRKSRHRLRARRGLEAGEPTPGRALYLRMTLNERLQHGALLVSFTVLVVTGFALLYPEAWLVEGLKRFSGGLFELRGVAHRVAGVVLILASIVHLFYLTATSRGREFFRDILPRRGDLRDMGNALRYALGRTRERPRFGRFSYIEKSEYWALVWGTIVMSGTGIILWFQDPFIALLSKLGWDVARVVHVYEAVLATLAILVWHLYFVIFNPDVYPMNTSWWSGTLSEAEMEEEHPRELEALRRKKAEESQDPEGGAT
jgi:formate dehydrogenase gamma subunit